MSKLRIAWVINSVTSGGIGTVCKYAAERLARLPEWDATVVSINEFPSKRTDAMSGVHYVTLGLEDKAPQRFLAWLKDNPQHYVITSDVPTIEPAFQYFPKETLHIIQLHDSFTRIVNVAIRNSRYVDGIVCVAHHITDYLRKPLNNVNYRGVLETVHNGAAFPLAPIRTIYSGPLRLIYMGSMDPIKGILDTVPILQKLRKIDVPVTLKIVGGHHELLERRFKQKRLESLVTWIGRVPHEECYKLASASDLFLMLSRKEAFGMVTIEAMSMGCVPIAYNVTSGNIEIIENEKSGILLPIGDFESCANAINSLHKNREHLLRLSEGAMHRSRTQFNETMMADRLCGVLKQVQKNAEIHKSERKLGLPYEVSSRFQTKYSFYQLISPTIRNWLRNRIGAYPRLCLWFLKHW